jgi:xanthine/uracil/vitamin C permease (AzgA family)
MTENSEIRDEEEYQAAHSRSSQLFDLRYLIGGLMSVYGIVLIIVGITDSQAEVDKAAGIRINLWMGLGMLVLGLLFLLWARTRPLQVGGPSAAEKAGLTDEAGPPPEH